MARVEAHLFMVAQGSLVEVSHWVRLPDLISSSTQCNRRKSLLCHPLSCQSTIAAPSTQAEETQSVVSRILSLHFTRNLRFNKHRCKLWEISARQETPRQTSGADQPTHRSNCPSTLRVSIRYLQGTSQPSRTCSQLQPFYSRQVLVAPPARLRPSRRSRTRNSVKPGAR